MQVQKQSENRSVWQLDADHSSIEFMVKKLFFITVRGRLTKLNGAITLHEDSLKDCSVEATIGAASIDTANQKRDAHVRSAFLGVTDYPVILFRSSEVARGKDRDMLKVKGVLTIRDTNRDVMLDVTEVDRSRSPNGEEVIYYVAETELNRFDFGVNAWRGVVGQKLKVVINVQANRV
jgi:polyisoprenoid-binding protein YceI